MAETVVGVWRFQPLKMANPGQDAGRIDYLYPHPRLMTKSKSSLDLCSSLDILF